MSNKANLLYRTTLTITMTVLVLASPFVHAHGQQAAPVTNSPSMGQTEFYFPAGAIGGWAGLFAGFLERSGEPSLVASKDSALLTYRAESLNSDGQMLAARLVVNADDSGSVFLTEDSVPRHVLRKIQRGVSAADVRGLLQKIEKSGFWSMPSTESEQSGGPAKHYTVDGSIRVFEGNRHGAYHVALRRVGSDYTAFDDMLDFMLGDLAGVKNIDIRPRREPGAPSFAAGRSE